MTSSGYILLKRPTGDIGVICELTWAKRKGGWFVKSGAVTNAKTASAEAVTPEEFETIKRLLPCIHP